MRLINWIIRQIKKYNELSKQYDNGDCGEPYGCCVPKTCEETEQCCKGNG